MMAFTSGLLHAQSFDLQGHRGCRGWMPENTVAAMIHGLKMGATTLELDVVVSKDSVVVVSHDPYMNADFTLQPDGSVFSKEIEKEFVLFEMTYSEIASWDVGMKPHPKFPQQQRLPARKPRLEDLIDSIDAYARLTGRLLPRYNIETKSRPAGDGKLHPPPADFVHLLMDVISRKGIAERVTIQSFDRRTLQTLHQSHPNIQTSILVDASDRSSLEMQINALGFVPSVYSPAWQLVTPELVQSCHIKGMRIIPWTVNERMDIERFHAMGVDGVITDYPEPSLLKKRP